MLSRKLTNLTSQMSPLSHCNLQRDQPLSHLEGKQVRTNHHQSFQLQSSRIKLQQMSLIKHSVPLQVLGVSLLQAKLKEWQASLMWLSLMEKSKWVNHIKKHSNLSNLLLLSSRMSCFNILPFKVVFSQIKISKPS